MDFGRILTELRLEREQLEQAILSLERLSLGGAKRRGRPPAWLARVKESSEKKGRGRPADSKNKKAPGNAVSDGQ